ncbi:MAG TPA: hypothetical protein VFI97_07370, partial [Arthrobacter sp.]|nr:hypothetical protein [Arthrobacter sp.]
TVLYLQPGAPKTMFDAVKPVTSTGRVAAVAAGAETSPAVKEMTAAVASRVSFVRADRRIIPPKM